MLTTGCVFRTDDRSSLESHSCSFTAREPDPHALDSQPDRLRDCDVDRERGGKLRVDDTERADRKRREVARYRQRAVLYGRPSPTSDAIRPVPAIAPSSVSADSVSSGRPPAPTCPVESALAVSTPARVAWSL